MFKLVVDNGPIERTPPRGLLNVVGKTGPGLIIDDLSQKTPFIPDLSEKFDFSGLPKQSPLQETAAMDYRDTVNPGLTEWEQKRRHFDRWLPEPE